MPNRQNNQAHPESHPRSMVGFCPMITYPLQRTLEPLMTEPSESQPEKPQELREADTSSYNEPHSF